MQIYMFFSRRKLHLKSVSNKQGVVPQLDRTLRLVESLKSCRLLSKMPKSIFLLNLTTVLHKMTNRAISIKWNIMELLISLTNNYRKWLRNIYDSNF